MVKGLSRRVVLVKSPDPDLFEEAIFILRDDGSKGMTSQDILRQAEKIAAAGVSVSKKHRRRPLPAPLFALGGAAVTALIWIITSIA